MDYVQNALDSIASSFPVRRTAKQRAAFRDWLLHELSELGWEATVARGGRWYRTENVVTHNSNPEVILLAHYDTGGRLPFGYTALGRLLGHGLWAGLLSGFLLALLSDFLWDGLASRVLASPLPRSHELLFDLSLILALCLPTLINNRHNHNDNTSGVLVLLGLAHALSDHPELKHKVQLAFVDLEERGLWGSRRLRRSWREQGVDLARATIINFDCVGWGSTPVVSYVGPRERSEAIYQQLKASRDDVAIVAGLMSDHYSFRREGASGVMFANRVKYGRGFEVPNVHTPRDCRINLDNVVWLVTELVRFCRMGSGDAAMM